MAKVPYETQLRACLRDFEAMVSNELEYCRTGRHPGREPMRNCMSQWAALLRDARNVLNRESNSYGDKEG